MGLLFQSGTAIFVPHSHPCQYLSFIDMTLFRQVSYCFSLFYPANDDEPLFITVLHKKHPKSFVSNFWGAVQNEEASFFDVFFKNFIFVLCSFLV